VRQVLGCPLCCHLHRFHFLLENWIYGTYPSPFPLFCGLLIRLYHLIKPIRQLLTTNYCLINLHFCPSVLSTINHSTCNTPNGAGIRRRSRGATRINVRDMFALASTNSSFPFSQPFACIMRWLRIETTQDPTTTSTGSLRKRWSHERRHTLFRRLNYTEKPQVQPQLLYILSEQQESDSSPSPSPSPPPSGPVQDSQAGAVQSRPFRSSSHSSRSGSESIHTSPAALQTEDERDGVATSEDGERYAATHGILCTPIDIMSYRPGPTISMLYRHPSGPQSSETLCCRVCRSHPRSWFS
jgi:hypothetical protein